MRNESPDPDGLARAASEGPVPRPPPTLPSVDDVGEASFPASDPPAVWTWDPRPSPSVSESPDEDS